MARPNSKYFLPVIKKLKAERAEESILIDENFKQELKVQLMQKFFPQAEVLTSNKDLHVQEAFDHPLDEKFRFGDFLKKWRFPIAAVPSFLLLTIVAARFFTLPVPISSDEKVPVLNNNSQQNGVIVSTSSEVVKKVRTFDGSQILARVQEKNAQEVNEVQFTNDSFTPNNSEVSEPEKDVQKITTSSVPTQKVSDDSQKTFSQPEQKVSENKVNNQESSSNVVDPSKLAGDVNDVPLENDTSNTGAQNIPTDDQSENSSLDINADNFNTTANFSQPQEVVPTVNVPVINEAPVQKLLNTSVPVTQQVIPKVNLTPVITPETLNAPVNSDFTLKTQAPSVNVLYGDELTSAQKAKLESQVISPWVTGKEILSVYVYFDENELLKVELSFKDGTTLEKSYAFDTEKLLWNEAMVTKQFYFDNNLHYVRKFSIQTRD